MLGFVLAGGFVLAAPEDSRTPSNVGGEGSIRLDNYRSWHKVNPTPLELPSPLAFLCRTITPAEAALDSRSPHNNRWFTVYVNPAGKSRMHAAREAKSRFPVGTIILKEKLTAQRGGRVELITGMVKRASGFDPEAGDWQYFVADGAGKAQSGTTDHCKSCHSKMKDYDYVYRTYLPPAASLRRRVAANR